jgi:hypothetical protein
MRTRRKFEGAGLERLVIEVIYYAIQDSTANNRVLALDAFLFLMGGGSYWSELFQSLDITLLHAEYVTMAKNEHDYCLAQNSYAEAINDLPRGVTLQEFARALDKKLAVYIREHKAEIIDEIRKCNEDGI